MIELSALCKRYADRGSIAVDALRDISLTIAAGSYVALTGPSGSGKSTLLNILGALDRPTSGSYELNGTDVYALSDSAQSTLRNQRIGFVFQSFYLMPRLNVLENVLLPARYAPDAEPDANRARALLERVGLSDRLQHRPTELSGGQQQRVAIARALLHKPSILLADEPTGNLDSQSAREVLKLIDELHSDGQTVVLVTHDPEVASRAQRQLRMRDGRIDADV